MLKLLLFLIVCVLTIAVAVCLVIAIWYGIKYLKLFFSGKEEERKRKEMDELMRPIPMLDNSHYEQLSQAGGFKSASDSENVKVSS